MIYYVVTKGNLNPIRMFLDSWGRELSTLITPLTYDDLFRKRRLPVGTYIFSDIERLAPETAERASHIWKALADYDPNLRLLNHPTGSMKRYELLRTLYERKWNRFNVYRLTEARLPQRFPVFLRGENDHDGNKSPLLGTLDELDRALEEIQREGSNRDSILITEFFDSSDHLGIFRKYSSFNLAGRIIPRHLFFSRKWMLKGPELVEQPMIHEEKDYVLNNPHENFLTSIFKLARIDYGRIDYALLDNGLQVWEINTNPWIMSYIDGGGPGRLPVHRHFYQNISEALRSLDGDASDRIGPENPLPDMSKVAVIEELARQKTKSLMRKIVRLAGLKSREEEIFRGIKRWIRLFWRDY